LVNATITMENSKKSSSHMRTFPSSIFGVYMRPLQHADPPKFSVQTTITKISRLRGASGPGAVRLESAHYMHIEKYNLPTSTSIIGQRLFSVSTMTFSSSRNPGARICIHQKHLTEYSEKKEEKK
jgi:hypothetical protein